MENADYRNLIDAVGENIRLRKRVVDLESRLASVPVRAIYELADCVERCDEPADCVGDNLRVVLDWLATVM